jgi:hypothetical protein
MVTHLLRPAGWTSRHLRHLAGIFRQGRNPAARVYESIGSDLFLAPAPGWLSEPSGPDRSWRSECMTIMPSYSDRACWLGARM